MSDHKRRCTNPTCYMRDLSVRTEATECIACHDDMPTDTERLFGDFKLGSIFGANL